VRVWRAELDAALDKGASCSVDRSGRPRSGGASLQSLSAPRRPLTTKIVAPKAAAFEDRCGDVAVVGVSVVDRDHPLFGATADDLHESPAKAPRTAAR